MKNLTLIILAAILLTSGIIGLYFSNFAVFFFTWFAFAGYVGYLADKSNTKTS